MRVTCSGVRGEVRRFAYAAALALGACVIPRQSSAQSPGGPLYNPHADPRTDIAAALSRAYTNHTLVLLEFGANWCPACHALAALFADPKVQPFLGDHFEVVRIDIGDFDRNRDVVRKYALQGGIPAAVVLDSAGEVIAVMQSGRLARDETVREVLADLRQWGAAKP